MMMRQAKLFGSALVLWAVVSRFSLTSFLYSQPSYFAFAAEEGDSVESVAAVEARARAAFASFETRFNKRYANDEERSRRFDLYKKRAATWPELRARFPETGFGETMFTDMTDEERAGYVLPPTAQSPTERLFGANSSSSSKRSAAQPHGSTREKRATPTNWNWCDTTNNKCAPITNQGNCGSCWVFGSIAALEIQNAIATGNVYSLSEEQICNCNTAYDGVCCCGGNAVAVYGTFKEYTLASLYPYTFVNADLDCSNDQKTCQSKQTYVTISGYEYKNLPSIDIEDYIYANGAFAVSMFTDTENGIYDYTSGFIPCTSNTQHNHLIALVGFGVDANGTEYYIGRNSWGSTWGINGYFWVKKSYPCYIGVGSGYRPLVIPHWTCLASHYDTSDGCHCGCGAYDPDCGKSGQTLIGCSSGQVCTTTGTCCTPGTCSSLGVECGSWDDSCGGQLDCGTCAYGFCDNGTCFCVPDTCSSLGKECGTWDDNCGGQLDCGSCTLPAVCTTSGTCCTPDTCSSLGVECGNWSNGCGGQLDCGTCAYGFCTNGECICTPDTCSSLGKDCGTWSDGCSGTLYCGSCTSPDVCTNGECICTPATCSSLGVECGSWDDSCGGQLDCGTCAYGFCDNGTCFCVPDTCSSLGKECGTWDDNCGGQLDCGSCTSPSVCSEGQCVLLESISLSSAETRGASLFAASSSATAPSLIAASSGALRIASSSSTPSGGGNVLAIALGIAIPALAIITAGIFLGVFLARRRSANSKKHVVEMSGPVEWSEFSPNTSLSAATLAPMTGRIVRFAASAGESLTFKGSLGFAPGYAPPTGCRDAVLASETFLLSRVPLLRGIVAECEQATAVISNSPETEALIVRHGLTPDEVFALVLYTFDIGNKGKASENFYFQLNDILRTRSQEGLAVIQGFMWFASSALRKLPNFQGTVFRGNNSPDIVAREYTTGREIFWSGFTSTTVDLSVARQFAGSSGVVFRIKVNSGKVISAFSVLGNEKEVLLPPNAGLFVSKPIHTKTDGMQYVDLTEKADKFTW